MLRPCLCIVANTVDERGNVAIDVSEYPVDALVPCTPNDC